MGRVEALEKLSNAWNDAWNSRDPASLATFMAPGSTYYETDMSDPVEGPSGVRAAAEKTWADWPSATFETVSLTVQGDRSIVEWRSSATHKSGVHLRIEGVDVLEWAGDRIAAARVYYDVHQRAVALGE